MLRPDKTIIRYFLGIIVFLTIFVITGYWLYEDLERMVEFTAQFMVGLTLLGVAVAYWTFKPDIERLVEKLQPDYLHSAKLSLPFEIMSKGKFEHVQNITEFCVPYPYQVYREYELRLKLPKSSDMMNFIVSKVEMPEYFRYIPINRSPEAQFDQAMKHLESYKELNTAFNDAKKSYDDFVAFCKKNNENSKTVLERELRGEHQPEPFYSEAVNIERKFTDELQIFQKRCDILSQRLDTNRVVIKGKCDACR